jgi:hypothetical protein
MGLAYTIDSPIKVAKYGISSVVGFTIQKYAVLTDSKNLRFPSDHFPVLIEISIK